MPDRDTGVRIPELAAFRRDLKKLHPAVDKELAKELRAGAQDVAKKARAAAPKGTGEYARSIRVFAAKGGVGIGSRLPQAGVLHWGGTIRPRGVPITFKPRPVVYEAAEREVDVLVERAGDAVERAARKAGFK